MTHHYLYILSSHQSAPADGPIFISTTRNLARRVTQHRMGRAAVDAFRIDRLVYVERFNSIEAATDRADALRSASREWVNALVGRKNPDWRDLSSGAMAVLQKAA